MYIIIVHTQYHKYVYFDLSQAPDQRGTTPLLAAYKNGCVEVVEWLLAHVAHLPSDQDCQKALMSPMPADTDLLPQRSKCLELIMKVGSLHSLLPCNVCKQSSSLFCSVFFVHTNYNTVHCLIKQSTGCYSSLLSFRLRKPVSRQP